MQEHPWLKTIKTDQSVESPYRISLQKVNAHSTMPTEYSTHNLGSENIMGSDNEGLAMSEKKKKVSRNNKKVYQVSELLAMNTDGNRNLGNNASDLGFKESVNPVLNLRTSNNRPLTIAGALNSPNIRPGRGVA